MSVLIILAIVIGCALLAFKAAKKAWKAVGFVGFIVAGFATYLCWKGGWTLEGTINQFLDLVDSLVPWARDTAAPTVFNGAEKVAGAVGERISNPDSTQSATDVVREVVGSNTTK